MQAVPDVVLGDEVACKGVQAPCEETGEEQVEEGPRAEGLHEGVVEDELGDQVDEVPLRERLCAHKTWP